MRMPARSNRNRIGETHAGFRNMDKQNLSLCSRDRSRFRMWNV